MNSIMFREKIRHLGNNLAALLMWHHTVIWLESDKEGLEEGKHGGAVVLWVRTDSVVRRLRCGSKGQRISTHTPRYLF